ncbi:MAG: prepilin-type N-terminal cleavage/methylation domain-containing protein [Rhodomicrobium sp.]|nr:prepilin-type N-terminal cleavage/methylation domain-containing protein [Rhodomicrobium sp.]
MHLAQRRRIGGAVIAGAWSMGSTPYIRAPSEGGPASPAEQLGFSLFELIVALAIVALASAALFQSANQWWRLSARSAAAADSALSAVADQIMFQRVVRGLIYAWPEEEQLFTGAPNAFSGITRTPLHALAPDIAPVTLAILEGINRRLVYQAGGFEWTLKDLGQGRADLSYLGADNVWRSSWPPEQNPEPGPFNDAAFYATPQLPLAIALTISAPGGSEVWIADVASAPLTPPIRLSDQLVPGGED